MATTELSASSRLFSSAVVRELGKTGRSGLLARLLDQSGVAAAMNSDATVGEAFDRAFGQLRRLGNRDEYVYRTAIAQKILLGRHNLRTATMLGEARVGSSKADVVVFNGTSTAYEIKSERDSLARLRSQVSAYARVFAAVNVVTSPSHVAQVLRQIPDGIGVLILTSRFTLKTERRAVTDSSRTDPLAILDFVRVSEAFEILRGVGVEPPRVPNTQMRAALRNVFTDLEPGPVHDLMVSTLKVTRSQRSAETYVQSIPMSLRAAMLTLRMDDASEQRLHDATRLPIGAALAWR
ncbi:sce7726 family protein [Microbacterium sp. RURRCA19A]|uniref:sce7726 family protein n=1 Tax=Microbacterium sp. RURRCA19A TaxID=1907391 RepID=UPI00158AFCDC|nr:sce7726 family protein [Microbacterium sp. RURRCA19A]